ncbi:hypothetical protein ACT691_06920 [Vibrio metschnikovii]
MSSKVVMWFLAKDLVGLPGLPNTPSGIKYRADKSMAKMPEALKEEL